MFKSYDAFVPQDLQDEVLRAERDPTISGDQLRAHARHEAKKWLRNAVMKHAGVEYAKVDVFRPIPGTSIDGRFVDNEVHIDSSTNNSTRFAVVIADFPSASTMIFDEDSPLLGRETQKLFKRDEHGLLVPKEEPADDALKYDQAQVGQLYSFTSRDPHGSPPIFPGEFRGFMYTDLELVA